MTWSNEGTHVGEWMGVPPTMKPVTARGCDIHLLRDGRLAEHWDVVDLRGHHERFAGVADGELEIAERVVNVRSGPQAPVPR